MALVIIQIVIATVMKGAADDLIHLFMTLQILVALTMYDIAFPANYSSFSEQLETVVEGDFLSIEFLI
jgi:hypothetical protein